MHQSFLSPNRELALSHLSTQHPSRLRVVSQTFEQIDGCLGAFERHSPAGPFATACGVALVKGKNFAVCSFGLIADGYGQESGVLLRLLVEHIELLNYLEKFPDEAGRALENKLPTAGARAMRINGKFKFLRDFLNENSSHGSFSDHSVGHVRNRDGSINKRPNFGATTFDANFRLTAVFTIFLLRAAVECIRPVDGPSFDDHAKLFDKLIGRARDVFNISANEEA
ncbi:hypothetical protein [Paucibacter sp. Y2R2-4]|uniref:hypothetical protein n=1 Tax=Paucibacter sp. Y2R2-4 TaxID=2893553 RepID=UPI0021E43BB1|nr:hypothetical protein [Paucibacter sp. Y2R2-4]MCV2349493.1 hypothetical protein [Paucibacter sp. Y2R2-4]